MSVRGPPKTRPIAHNGLANIAKSNEGEAVSELLLQREAQHNAQLKACEERMMAGEARLMAQLSAVEARLNAQAVEFDERVKAFDSQKGAFEAEILGLRNQLEARAAPVVMGPPTNGTSPRAPRKIARKDGGGVRDMSCSDSDGAANIEFPALPSPRALTPAGSSVDTGLIKSSLSGRGSLSRGNLNSNNSNGSSNAANNNNNNNNSSTNNNNSSNNNNNCGSSNATNVNYSGAGRGASSTGVGRNGGRKKVLQAIDTDLFSVKRQLVEAKIASFAVKQASRNGPVKITIADEGEVVGAKAALAAAAVSYHEFKWSDEKRKCFVIRGLVGAGADELPEIRQDLLDAGLPDDIELALHVTGYMRARPNERHSAPVKLIVPPTFDVKALAGIRSLNHIAVRFEAFKSSEVMQCKNCQRFGHSAAGCQHEHRCVKCGLNHLRDACPRTHNAAHKLKCCNCGGEHTANNVNSCSFFKQRYGDRQQQRQQQAPKKVEPAVPVARPAPSPRRAGVSFAQAASGGRGGGAGSSGRSSSRSGSGGGSSSRGGSGGRSSGSGGFGGDGGALGSGLTTANFLSGFNVLNQRLDRLELMFERFISQINA